MDNRAGLTENPHSEVNHDVSPLCQPVLVFALGGLACAAQSARVPYALQGGRGLVASNSPMLDGHLAPARHPDGIAVPYALLVLNVGQPLVISPEDITAQLETVVCAARCRLLDRTGSRHELPAAIERGQQVRLDCIVKLPDAARSLLAAGDRTLDLRVSLADGDPEGLAFRYFLRAEDAR